jgi:hypothetical protein
MRELNEVVGLGIVGNIAKAEESGESFNRIAFSGYSDAPKGIYPFYAPVSEESKFYNLRHSPLSAKKLKIPSIYDNIQVEPEVLLLCDVRYHNDFILNIVPKKFTAFNDATIHRLTTHKISANKNWGENSKGVSSKWIDIDHFREGGVLDRYSLVSFVKRNGRFENYTVNTPVINYPTLHDNLVDWTLKQLNNQREDSSLESIREVLKEAGNPKKIALSIGSTEYTQFGQTNFIQEMDEIYIVLYDNTRYRPESIKAYLLAYGTRNVDYDGMIILHQTAYL